VTERLLAMELAAQQGWTADWMPADLDRFPVVLGLWKGDLTLKREIVAALAHAQQSGEIDAIVAKYIPGTRVALANSPGAGGSGGQELPDDRLGRVK
jgi:hypothetical protein